MELKTRISKIKEELSEGLIEREEIMDLTFLSAIAGESLFMLGPPGVAKSLIARRLKYAFNDATSFEYLMNRFSTPDEIFGPISISKLKEQDKLERKVEHYLPGANVVFLDEIWKAGPSIQNTLLTILNEKIYRNGEQEIPVDLFGIISASNELPAKNQGLEALWDRFILRYEVSGIRNKDSFASMITDVQDIYRDPISKDLKISKEELSKWQTARDQVEIPQEVLQVIHHIRLKLYQYNDKIQEKAEDPHSEDVEPIYISDRRWKKIIKILRTAAYLHDRKKVDLMDCFLIPFMIWSHPSQIPMVKDFIRDSIRDHGYTVIVDKRSIKNAIEEIEKDVDQETHYIKEVDRTLLDESEIKIGNQETPCYILEDFNNTYKYIRKKDVDDLELNENRQVYIYDHRGNSRSRYNIQHTEKNLFDLDINRRIYSLKTKRVSEKKRETKKPHDVLIENWDKKLARIKKEIEKNILMLDQYVANDLKHIHENMFVPLENTKVVTDKIDEIKVELNQMEIRTDKLKEKYHSIQ